MAQQAERMRINDKKRERRPSNGSSADSGTGGFAVSINWLIKYSRD